MKRMMTCLLAMLGLTACSQENFENTDVAGFEALLNEPNATLLDVRTAEEYAEGHIAGAVNIDQAQSDFLAEAKVKLSPDRTIAVYCRSGRRSASAAGRLAAEGFRCVNLMGGILAWKEAGKDVTNDTYEVDVFRTKSGKTVRFHALVHASIRIDFDGKVIMVDPVTKHSGRTIDYSAMPKADYIFVTHEHGDHFDKEALRQLTGQQTRLVMNQRCVDMYGSGQTMVNGQSSMVNGLKVEAVPAYNTTEGRTQFHPKGRDNGYILTLDGLRIYIAGDTEDMPEMAGIKGIDVAFLPCNQPYTMTPEQLVKAAKAVKPKVLFPYHYGQTDVSGVPALLKDDGIDVRIRHYE